ncbi:MAG: RDD family protein, partial [Acidobacteria bacterium]|nr:RDD family protein [Acidobacteriota bacterium]
VAYFALMISTRGQTVGGMALSVKVVSADGSMPTTEQGFKRSIYHALGVIPCVGGLALLAMTIWGLVTIFTDAQHRTPWDQFGDTLVIDA